MFNTQFSAPKKQRASALRKAIKAFNAANKRVDKAFSRYKKALLPLYMPYYTGARKSDASKELADVYLTCLNSDGSLRERATDLSWTFYRRGRGGKFYEKPQARRDGFSEKAWDNYVQAYKLAGQDYLDLRAMELAIDAAIDERECAIDELKSLGVDAFELWA